MVIDIPQKDNWTYADYNLLPAELRCEIINGKLVLPRTVEIKSNPSHQSVKHQLKKVTEPFPPSIIVITGKNKNLLLDYKCIIEIVSPGNNPNVRITKKNIYEKTGIKNTG